MAFFHHPIFSNNGASANPSFTPLFRLLDDFDNYSRQGHPHSSRRTAIPTWTPKFDVRETGETYELHGELPGMSKENVNIEFSEPQTMVIRGKVERSYSSGTPPAAVEDTAMSGAITEGDEPKSPRASPHQATVEDEQEGKAGETGWEDVSNKSAEKSAEVAERDGQQPAQQKKPTDTAKYWLTERSIGEFSRTFNFPSRVENDNVTASFKDGILSVVVPKAKKHEVRRVAIN